MAGTTTATAMAAQDAVGAIFRAVMTKREENEVARMLDAEPWLREARAGEDDRPILVHAAEQGRARIVAMLLERGADVNSTTGRGRSALFSAASKGHEEVVAVLLRGGVSMDMAHGAGGVTALMVAAMRGHVGVIQQLAQHVGAGGLDWKDGQGRTALYWACAFGQREAARVLLLAGADYTITDLQDGKGQTPRLKARQMGHKRCAAVLKVRPPSLLCDGITVQIFQ